MAIVYYAQKAHDGHVYCYQESLNPYLMLGDFPLFDTQEACINYWKEQGIDVESRR